MGHNIIEAADGAEAVARYRQVRPDAVLMDITMPKKDGVSALREIMLLDPAGRVAMITALGEERLAFKAVRTGAVGFLVKPFTADRLQTALGRILAQ